MHPTVLQNPQEMIRGQIFSEMIRIQARKSELQAESRSYGPKVGDTAGQTPRIRTESPRNGPRMGFCCFYRNPPLKAFLNPPKLMVVSKRWFEIGPESKFALPPVNLNFTLFLPQFFPHSNLFSE